MKDALPACAGRRTRATRWRRSGWRSCCPAWARAWPPRWSARGRRALCALAGAGQLRAAGRRARGLAGVRRALSASWAAAAPPGRRRWAWCAAGTSRTCSGSTTTRASPGDLEQLEQLAAAAPSRERFLSDLTLDPPAATGAEAGPPHLDEDYLILSTIHSAKGQEWDTVFVLNAADGCIPSDLATGHPAEIEEERRLLYVAMTRAKNALSLDSSAALLHPTAAPPRRPPRVHPPDPLHSRHHPRQVRTLPWFRETRRPDPAIGPARIDVAARLRATWAGSEESTQVGEATPHLGAQMLESRRCVASVQEGPRRTALARPLLLWRHTQKAPASAQTTPQFVMARLFLFSPQSAVAP